jgi:phosphate transport system substrate-binding protein
VSGNPGALGVLGYSFLEANLDTLKAVPLNGVSPTAETISSLQYPGARQVYVYAKGEHVGVIPGMKEFLAEYARGWGAGGYLAQRGLIPLARRRAGQGDGGCDPADGDGSERTEVSA